MDIFSHGLYGGVLVGRKSKKSFWTAFFFGIAPDLFSFGVLMGAALLGFASAEHLGAHAPNATLIPPYIYVLYNFTHSLIIFAGVFALTWLYFRRPIWEMLAWGFHVILDIFTHAIAYFPTPFLWPISNYYFNGHNWGTPIIFIPNIITLFVLYGWWFFKRRARAIKK